MNQDGLKTELEVTPDRVHLICEHASENREIPYGFIISVLDDESTVLSVAQMNTLSKKDCSERLEKIGRILKDGKRIYIAGIGNINEPREAEEWRYTFPKFGTFNTNGRVLQFFAIANEHGACFDAYHGDRKPCPHREEFPITPRLTKPGK